MNPLGDGDMEIVQSFLEEINHILDDHTRGIILIQKKARAGKLSVQETQDSLTALKSAHRAQLIEILLTCIINGKLDRKVSLIELRSQIHLAMEQMMLENILDGKTEL